MNSLTRKGYKRSREIVDKQIEGRRQFYETNRSWNFNKPHSEETKQKISQAMKEYWERPSSQATRDKLAHLMKEYWKRQRRGDPTSRI